LGTAIFGAVLAYLSRFANYLAVREIFKAIGFGNPSLIEHFLAGFAAPATIVGPTILVMSFAAKPRFIKSPIRILALGKFRRWLMTRSRPIYVTHWAGVISFLYAIASLQWEARQIEVHGFFQSDQFLMDVAGGLAFYVFIWVILEKNRQRAKSQRSFSLL
ncbi:hypothetical protein, partial [Pseudomonas viridiflava]|uniref:hypothetical protein n=2 Tax=Pseudomonas TaxID=286 RepID=UPI0013CE73AA